jgi:hypothetical protein
MNNLFQRALVCLTVVLLMAQSLMAQHRIVGQGHNVHEILLEAGRIAIVENKNETP